MTEKLNDVLAEWDNDIDEKIEDARGIHDTVNAMRESPPKSQRQQKAPPQGDATAQKTRPTQEARAIQVVVRPSKTTLVVELSERQQGASPVVARRILKGPTSGPQKVTFTNMDPQKTYTATVLTVSGIKPVPPGKQNIRVRL